MNADLLTEDLKKKRASNESFWLIGQPDVELERIDKGPDKGKFRVTVNGFDYYNTRTGHDRIRRQPTRSPCGCSTPTMTGAASFRARFSSWPRS